MTSIRRHARLITVGASCAAIGAGASAIASAGAATSSSSRTTSAHAHKHAFRGGLRGFAARAVHGDIVVPTKTGFATVTFDRGRVDSVSGQRLTLTEGTPKASYRTVTVTVPSSAIVRDNGRRSDLAAVTQGQRVLVLTGPKHTRVIARTPR
jgi:hypothetical protein